MIILIVTLRHAAAISDPQIHHCLLDSLVFPEREGGHLPGSIRPATLDQAFFEISLDLPWGLAQDLCDLGHSVGFVRGYNHYPSPFKLQNGGGSRGQNAKKFYGTIVRAAVEGTGKVSGSVHETVQLLRRRVEPVDRQATPVTLSKGMHDSFTEDIGTLVDICVRQANVTPLE